MRSASTVVVGAGVVGASAAWHLARRGEDVLLVDGSPAPGRGSTGAATGGFRAQFGTEVEVRLSLLAREELLRFEEETGVDPGFVPAGYLWLAAGEEELDALRRALAVQHEAGLREAREVGAEEAADVNPAASLDGIVGGAFCPTDGFVRPMEILRGYLEAGRREGVRALWGSPVTGFDVVNGRIASVRLEAERIACAGVVNAAGPWAAVVGRLAGAELPVEPLRRQVAVTFPFGRLPETMPMTVWVSDGFHLRVRDGRVLLLRPAPGVPGRPFDTAVDPDWLRDVARTAARRVPVLQETAVDPGASWAGLYEMSPDRHAILGRAPECPNLLLANGSSGHGVMHAPALGRLVAEIAIDGEATSLDVRALRPERFREGDLNPFAGVL